jgi:hypothetical protein|tara:strand:+ start:43 stop:348 length:306 start_codon:yes stop_codon:yes gene_type:complete
MKLINRLIRLTSGEEILCGIGTQDEKTTTVFNPVLLIPEPGATGRIGFMPYLGYSDLKDGLIIKEEHVMFIVEPEEAMAKRYAGMIDGTIEIMQAQPELVM